MAKTNNSNPLKHFNDEYAKRVAKLTKAQPGIQTNAAQNAKDIINRYNSINKDISNNVISDNDKMMLKKQYEDNIKRLKEESRASLRDAYIKNITGQDSTMKRAFKKYYPSPSPSPTFIDPTAGGIKKSGGQTKSKKK